MYKVNVWENCDEPSDLCCPVFRFLALTHSTAITPYGQSQINSNRIPVAALQSEWGLCRGSAMLNICHIMDFGVPAADWELYTQALWLFFTSVAEFSLHLITTTINSSFKMTYLDTECSLCVDAAQLSLDLFGGFCLLKGRFFLATVA